MSMLQPVHIVGLGALSPAGSDVRGFWRALFDAPCAPRRDAVPGFPAGSGSMQHGYIAQTADTAETAQAANDGACTLSRFDILALGAMQEALADAASRGLNLAQAHVGLIVGTAAGEADLAEHARHTGATATLAACHAYHGVDHLIDLLPLPMHGPAFSISNACAAGLYAIAHGADMIAGGVADAMLVVGVEVLSRVTQAGFQKMTALDPDSCRPFDAARNGTVLGEGASAVLLVSQALLSSSAARSYCSVRGAGFSCDAHHPTAPRPDGQGIRQAVQRALAAASIVPDQNDLVVPHGTGTPMNDRIEGQMLAQLLGSKLPAVELMPIKAHIGHCAGASGTFSVVAAAQALAMGEVPPALHLHRAPGQAGADCALQFRAVRQALPRRACHALVNAYGFGGNNVSMVLQGDQHA